MSLSAFLKIPEIHTRFQQEFPNIRGLFKSTKYTLLTPSSTNQYILVGIAFDYLMRFYIKYLNPNAIDKEWIACKGAELFGLVDVEIMDENIFFKNNDFETAILKYYGSLFDHNCSDEKDYEFQLETYKLILNTISEVKKNYANFLTTGIITDDLIKSCLFLAPLDLVFRTKDTIYFQDNLANIQNNLNNLISELRNLVITIPKNKFIATKSCLLNPNFGSVSGLTLGAEADIILDDIIIDIKTTKTLEFKRAYLHQLIGYYILAKLDGHTINKIGIYYSRHGYLFVLPIEQITNPMTFPDFADWFYLAALEGKNKIMQLPSKKVKTPKKIEKNEGQTIQTIIIKKIQTKKKTIKKKK